MSVEVDDPWQEPEVVVLDWDPDVQFLQICDLHEDWGEDTTISMIGPCDLEQWA